MQIKSWHKHIVFFSMALISCAMHFNHFSKDLMSIHVWRQTQTQSTITNFYEEDMNILKPRKNNRGDGDGVFRMEFPLMQWLVACLYKILGNHLIITRIFMFIIGLLSLAGMFRLIKLVLQNETMALIGAFAFNFSPSFYYYTINPLPDNFALCCSIWGAVMFMMWYKKTTYQYLIYSGLFLSIGALCKLPFILYFSFPLGYFLIEALKNKSAKGLFASFILLFAFILLPLAWYVSVIPDWHGNGVVNGMLSNIPSTAILVEYLLHNLISTLPELLLNYGSVPFFIAGFYFLYKQKAYKHKLFFPLVIWSFSVLGYFLFEINMIAKIHDYYLFPFYPMLFFLVSYGAYHLLILKNTFFKYFTFLALFILPFTAYIRMKDRWNPNSPGFNSDLLTYKAELQNAVPKNALCIAGNDPSSFIFFYYIDKKGWAFKDDSLTQSSMSDMINKGADYLYSDSPNIENNTSISVFFEKIVLEKGSIKIFKLKKNSE